MTLKSSRYVYVAAAVAAGLFGAPSYGAPAAPVVQSAPVAPQTAPPGVAATVDGDPVMTATVEEMAIRAAGPSMLDQLIDFHLIDAAAKKQNITATQAEVDAKKADIQKQIGSQPLEEALKTKNMTMAGLEDELRHRILLEKIAAKSITHSRMLHVRHILIATAPTQRGTDINKPHSPAAALAIIQKIQAQLSAGKSFAQLAKQYSEDPATRSAGGDLGAIDKTSDPFDGVLWAAVSVLKPGETTPKPVKSAIGYHLALLVSTSDDPGGDKQMYANIEKQIYASVIDKLMQGTIAKLRADAKIVKYQFN